MRLSDDRISGNLVRSYAPGEVRVGERLLVRSCLIAVDRIDAEWRPQSLRDLTLEDLVPILAFDPEIVVLGVGTQQRFPSAEWMAALLSRGIGCEAMENGAACRTYNILASEQRRVVAALLLDD